MYVFESKIIHQRLRQMLKVNFLPHGPMQSLQFFRGPVAVPILIQIPIQIPPPPPRDGHSFVLLSSTDEQGELLSRLEKAFP